MTTKEMTTRESISASLLYGAVVAFTAAAALTPLLLDNDTAKAASSQKTEAHCRDIISGKKQADMIEHAGCYSRNGFNLYMR